MAKNDAKKNKQAEPEQTPDTQTQQQTAEPCEAAPVPEVEPETTEQAISEAEQLRQELAEEKDRYLRLAAEYDNFRKRSQKERESLYTDLRAETVGKFLPVYDNLERALNQPTADEAYKKGVEMTMNGLVEIMQKLGLPPLARPARFLTPAATMRSCILKMNLWTKMSSWRFFRRAS